MERTKLKESRIYFGEAPASTQYVVVGGSGEKQQELDYPESGGTGQKNTTYDGKGGVPVGSFINRMLYAAKYGEINLLLSGDINPNSKILYERNPQERIAKVAPFLSLDDNPYPAIVDGRVVWIADAYTTSNAYPYSQSKSLEAMTRDTITDPRLVVPQPRDQINYMRNSVKAMVDAYDGTVNLYAWDEKDPILQTWRKAFPGIIKPQTEMSPELKQHLRYPEALFKVQRDVLSQYHIADPNAFYSGQDFWNVPNDPSGGGDIKQPPYYLSVKMPKTSAAHVLADDHVRAAPGAQPGGVHGRGRQPRDRTTESCASCACRPTPRFPVPDRCRTTSRTSSPVSSTCSDSARRRSATATC